MGKIIATHFIAPKFNVELLINIKSLNEFYFKTLLDKTEIVTHVFDIMS